MRLLCLLAFVEQAAGFATTPQKTADVVPSGSGLCATPFSLDLTAVRVGLEGDDCERIIEQVTELMYAIPHDSVTDCVSDAVAMDGVLPVMCTAYQKVNGAGYCSSYTAAFLQAAATSLGDVGLTTFITALTAC